MMPVIYDEASGTARDDFAIFYDCESSCDSESDMESETKSTKGVQPVTGSKTLAKSQKHERASFGPDPSTLSRNKKTRKHFKRFWCCYLLGIVILLGILLPIFFLVIFPAIIQLLVGKANLPINGGVFLANSPTTAIVSIDTALSIPAGIKATLDPVTLYIYNKKTTVFSPFLGLEIGKTQLDGYTEVKIADKLVTILNQTEMESWFEEVVQNSETALSVKGSTKVHLGALNYNVNIDKTQNIPTLNNLAGLGFGGLSLVLPADTDGTNFKGNLTLPNSSPLTIGLGNVTLNILSGPVLIGILRLQDVVAPPGNTSLAFRGELYFDAILQNLGTIIQSQASAIKDGNLNVSASGNSSLINGQHITYIENVLNKQVLSTQIPILTLVTQLAGSLLSGNTTLSNLGSLLGGLLGNLTGTSTSPGNISSLLGIFGSSKNVASVVSTVSKLHMARGLY